MNRAEIIEALKTIIKPYSEEVAALEGIDENTDFINDLKINSANLVDVVLDVEEQFGIEIDNDSMAKMLTVKATIEVIESKLSKNVG
ncbi:acyl carrier protein [Pedobacter aquatilis]|uniref:acyl carrier protein n=1 Tax=Pedobacter aquatilis TaxID=351343 RepID=UPI0025B5CBB3|nr:acyl carrier protein [Pedobacter aquatilis]MDN3585632.1 acyl carrier protein [Pedobacter aquatilis]